MEAWKRDRNRHAEEYKNSAFQEGSDQVRGAE